MYVLLKVLFEVSMGVPETLSPDPMNLFLQGFCRGSIRVQAVKG